MDSDAWFSIIFWIVLACIFIFPFFFERYMRTSFQEGFEGLMGVGESKFWARLVPRRGDVGPEQEQDGLIRDNRYFHDYADLQRFGAKTDFCRMVQQGDDIKNKFIACALGGTENLSSISFRGPSVKQGFILGRDDYMRDTNGDGREDYCRIVKEGEGTFTAKCNVATETGFSNDMVIDSNPPVDIAMLLRFYQGSMFWLRFRDDMLDYSQNLYVNVAGKAEVEENPPRPQTTEALTFNGLDQFLRIGDDSYLTFGNTVILRNMRAIHVWVKFEEFTNNAHIFDFGNGAGIDNVWLGILHRGNQGIDADEKTKSLICGDTSMSTVPDAPSGAQPEHEMSPQELMKTTGANVEEFTCDGFAVQPKVKSRNTAKPRSKLLPAKTADMIYEIWDKDQRKMRIKVPKMFTKDEWTHVVITATSMDAFRPDIAVYKNGKKAYIEPSGWLPQNSSTTKNYLGKSNWTDDTSQYANRDELFKGSIFDFRAYKTILGDKVVEDSHKWGKKLLGI